MNRINTLRSLNGAAGSPTDDSPRALAATLRQLAHIINQAGASPLPSGTSIDWPVPQALSAAALLEDHENEDGAFRGPGRILGPMFDADQAKPSPTRRYNLRTRHGGRFASASSTAARRASVAEIEADAEPSKTLEANGVEEGEEERAEMEINVDKSGWADGEAADGTATPGKTGTVMRDETHSDGTRKIEIQLRRSRGSVTLVIPKTPDADTQMAGSEANDAAHHPGISFQLSPGFQLPKEQAEDQQTEQDEVVEEEEEEEEEEGEEEEEEEEDEEEEEEEEEGEEEEEEGEEEENGEEEEEEEYEEKEEEVEADKSRNLHFFSDDYHWGPGTEAYADPKDKRGKSHSYNGHRQPSVGKRIEQILAYLRSNYTIDDPKWHIHVADIEAYLDFLLDGHGHAASPPPSQSERALGPEAAQVAEQQARLDEALVRLERDEMAARAEMQGRPTDPGSIAFDNAVHATQPPPILGAKTLAMISECRRHLKRNARFYSRPPAERARIVGNASDAQAAPSSGFLQNLLATSGRSFAPRLALNARVEARLPPAPEPEGSSSAERLEQEYLFGSEHALLENTPLGHLETHPFTVHMARYRRFRQHYMEEARILSEQAHGGDPNWATLPPTDGVFSHGFARAAQDGSLDYRQALPPHMERDRQLLQLLRGLNRLLLRRLDTAHRPLLDDVVKYAEQGARGEPAPHGGLVLRDPYDIVEQDKDGDGNGNGIEVRPLSESEARWLQFLLSDSTNEQLAQPLPRGPYMDEDKSLADANDPAAIQAKTDEDGSCSLYYAFAHRFQALLDADANNPDGLFPTADAFVPATAVVDAINRQSAGSTTAFSVYDGLHFLSRLSKAGRCRFRHFPLDNGHGVVQRPLLTIHPEHRLHKSPRADEIVLDDDEDEDPHFEDDSIGAPRRSTEVDASWDDTIARPSSRTVPARFRHFFCCLAFRFGRTLRTLETAGRAQWKAYLDREAARATSSDNDDHQIDRMRTSIQIWRDTYEKLIDDSGTCHDARYGGIPRSLRDVLRLAEPGKYHMLSGGRTAPLTETTAGRYIYGKLIQEAAQGRDAPINSVADPVSRGVWDWAQPEIVGEAPPHFFHMDRWPLHLQAESTAEQIQQGAQVAMDPEILWDPASEDLTPPEYLWTVSTDDRRYGFRRIEMAETSYRLGDTALQRQVVVQDITRRVAAAIGVPIESLAEQEPKTNGLLGWLGSKLGKRKRGDDDDEAEEEGVEEITFEITELPKAKKILKGFDWTELVTTTRKSGDGGVDEEEDDYVDEVDAKVNKDGLSEAEAWTDEDDQALIRELCRGT